MGNGDMLERAMLLALRFGWSKDEELAAAFDIVSAGGAHALGLETYGIAAGRPANFLLVAAENLAGSRRRPKHASHRRQPREHRRARRQGRWPLVAGSRMRTRLKAAYVMGFDGSSHELWRDGEVVFSNDVIEFVGRGFPGPVDRTVDYGHALISPGLIDLDALGDLDSGVLTVDNGDKREMGRLWSEDYLRRGPRETYSPRRRAIQVPLCVCPPDPQRHHDGAADRVDVLPRVGGDLRRVPRRRARSRGSSDCACTSVPVT